LDVSDSELKRSKNLTFSSSCEAKINWGY
jgi:hypothetical protein